MQSNLLSLWRIRAVAILLALIGAGAFFFIASPAFAANSITMSPYKDNNSDAQVDAIDWTMDENVTACTYDAADWTINTAGTINVTAITALSCATTTLTITVTATDDITGGATAPQISYANAGVADSVTLTSGAMTAKANQNATDGTAPRLISASPTSLSQGNSRTGNIVLTFSEAIDSTDDSIVLSPSVSSVGTWSVSDTVYTIDPGALAAGYNTVTFTQADDTSATGQNTFGGAESGNSNVASPLAFYVSAQTSGSGSTDATETTYDIDIISPNGGESYLPGEAVAVTWSSSGDAAMSAVNLNLMYEDDGSTVQYTLAEGITNDGSYTWTVPDIASDEVKIQIVGTDLADSLATDESDDYFSVGVASDDSEEEGGGGGYAGNNADEAGSMAPSPVTGEMEEVSFVEVGWYIRGESFDTVYYVDAGLVRRPFMDAQTFMTYEDDWSTVEDVTDATLATLTLGGPMLPNAGVVLVKVQSDAKTYALHEADGVTHLMWITSEEVAEDLFGNDWADYVIDVPATLFPRFEMGDDIERAADYEVSEDMKTREEVNS